MIVYECDRCAKPTDFPQELSIRDKADLELLNFTAALDPDRDGDLHFCTPCWVLFNSFMGGSTKVGEEDK